MKYTNQSNTNDVDKHSCFKKGHWYKFSEKGLKEFIVEDGEDIDYKIGCRLGLMPWTPVEWSAEYQLQDEVLAIKMIDGTKVTCKDFDARYIFDNSELKYTEEVSAQIEKEESKMKEGFKFGAYYKMIEDNYFMEGTFLPFKIIAEEIQGEIWTPTQLNDFGAVMALQTESGRIITSKGLNINTPIFFEWELTGLGSIVKVSSSTKEEGSSDEGDCTIDLEDFQSDESALSQLKGLSTQAGIEAETRYYVYAGEGQLLVIADNFESAQKEALELANTQRNVIIKLSVTLSKTIAEVKTEHKVKMIESSELEDLFSGASL